MCGALRGCRALGIPCLVSRAQCDGCYPAMGKPEDDDEFKRRPFSHWFSCWSCLFRSMYNIAHSSILASYPATRLRSLLPLPSDIKTRTSYKTMNRHTVIPALNSLYMLRLLLNFCLIDALLWDEKLRKHKKARYSVKRSFDKRNFVLSLGP